jgi:hypothetical protein
MSSSSSSSIDSSSSSSEIAVASVFGTTYFSNFRRLTDIANPVLGKDVGVGYRGYFDEVDGGLLKTYNNKGAIFTSDASKLFSMNKGTVTVEVSFEEDLVNGTLESLINDTSEVDCHILWGVNVGDSTFAQPGLLASYTPDGLEFTIWTSADKFTITDNTTNLMAGTFIKYAFAWGIEDLDENGERALIQINDSVAFTGNPPINNDSLEGANFWLLDTPYSNSNLRVLIKSFETYNELSDDVEEDLYSSSSDSFSSVSSDSSSSSIDSSSSSSIDSSSSSSIDSSSSSSIDSSSSSSSSSIDSSSSSSIDSSSSSSSS